MERNAHLTPAPAATIAAVVETLNVSWPSPPVPTMSTQLSAPHGVWVGGGVRRGGGEGHVYVTTDPGV
jgi:hypothetical protein